MTGVIPSLICFKKDVYNYIPYSPIHNKDYFCSIEMYFVTVNHKDVHRSDPTLPDQVSNLIKKLVKIFFSQNFFFLNS